MSDKRAYVALALNVTAASDIFTQDIEDLPAEVAEAVAGVEPARAPIAAPVAKSVTPADVVTLVPVRVSSKATKNGGMGYSVQLPDGGWVSSFSEEVGALLSDAKAGGKTVKLTLVTKGEYRNIVAAELVDLTA